MTFDALPGSRDRALEILLGEAPEVRAHPGNLQFMPTRIAGSETGILLHQVWEDEPAFTTYTAGPGFAAVGDALRPLMDGPPTRQVVRGEIA